MNGTQFALWPRDLEKDKAYPAGFEMSKCKAALQGDEYVAASHPPGVMGSERARALFLMNPAAELADLAWHVPRHTWRVEGEHPWSLDDEDLGGLQWEEVGDEAKVFRASLPAETRLYAWIAAQLQPRAGGSAHGITLSRVEMIKSNVTLSTFNFKLQQTAARLAANNGKNPFVREWPHDEVKTAMLRHLASRFAACEQQGVRVLPLWHGCSVDAADEIMCSGPMNFAADLGFFGPGIPFTPDLEYAAGFSTGVITCKESKRTEAGEFVLLLNMVNVGTVYPVTRAKNYAPNSNVCEFLGRMLYPGCDSHYALVDISTKWQAAKTEAPYVHHFEEVVAGHSSQVLPFARVFVKASTGQLRRFLGSLPSHELPHAMDSNE